MFLSAGNLILSQGSGDIAQLKGIATREPLNVLIFTIAGVSLIGLPPSAGFIAKWLLLTTSIESGQWWWVLVVLSGGLLAAMYLFKILSLAFDNTLDDGAVQRQPKALSSKLLTSSALVLALITLALGFNAEFILNISNPPVGVSGI
jgi:formate hydrogenlyase subunit 3/multisubunit Na+/H+ antiporter MnhD subunit